MARPLQWGPVMMNKVTRIAVVAALLSGACVMDEEVDGVGDGVVELEGAGTDGNERTWFVPASAQTRSQLGVYSWTLTIRPSGDTVINGRRLNKTVKYWQAFYASGSASNPWQIFESGEVFLAVRVDGSETYVEPAQDDPQWQQELAIFNAFTHDFDNMEPLGAAQQVAGDGLTGASSEDSGQSCQAAQASVTQAAIGFTVASLNALFSCASAGQGSGRLRDCLRDSGASIGAGLGYLWEIRSAESTCANGAGSTPPPGNHTPPPPPGNSGGGCGCGDSYQSWGDDETSESEWYFNSWKLKCMTYSVTTCVGGQCTTSEETDCWWEQSY